MNSESPTVTSPHVIQVPAAPEPAPTPTVVTPELLAQHSITADEYARIKATLGRVPSLTELGIYSVMWSEHCSYKSSKVHLKRLPTKSDRVVQGPGENAGIIDVGDGWGCAFKIESHNHPSYIEPFQGAATGVGGILRDIFTMNARPLAVMDSLRFGPISPEEAGDTPPEVIRKNHSIMEGVVSGIAGYGNCFGVPNLGGETRFEPCYSGNPLVNAFALGLVRLDEIFYAKATGIGNPVIYVGAKTGRDGIHGATMASEEFKEGSEQKRPNVQMGDPFMEKLLLEACLEAMKTGAVLGIQDMGAAGLTCSTCEMGARGGVGVEIELDNIPQRATGMTSYEIMLSESQERMLLVAEKGREDEVLSVFAKWGLDATIAGEVVAENRMRVRHHGELVADIPNESLTDDAPLYHRPVGEWKAPVPLDPPAEVLAELQKPRDYTADLKKLLASSNICSKRWVFEQYDSMVQTNTVQGPGGEAGVMRIKGSGTPGHERGLAMALAGNSRWCYLDPHWGAAHAVAEAARKVACTGAEPVAATNCLNFGNPEKPEIMAQLSSAIDGIGVACEMLGTPITGGNVSLYNETRGEGIYPTPVVGIIGILDDVKNAVASSFSNVGDSLLYLTSDTFPTGKRRLQAFGSSEYARILLNSMWGTCAHLDLASEDSLCGILPYLATHQMLHSATDVSDGGLAASIAKASFNEGIGVTVNLSSETFEDVLGAYFDESAGGVLLSCSPDSVPLIQEFIQTREGVSCHEIGETAVGIINLCLDRKPVIQSTVADLKQAWSDALESLLTEVHA
jgi:phosphoribosylformylglycinamidine synthase subunit PurL